MLMFAGKQTTKSYFKEPIWLINTENEQVM